MICERRKKRLLNLRLQEVTAGSKNGMLELQLRISKTLLVKDQLFLAHLPLPSKVNPTTYNFIVQQIRNQKLASKARRFTLEEKIFAITLLKASGKGYRLLSKIFVLPSVRTLTNLLNKLPFDTEINKQLFKSFKETVQKLPPKDRNCVRLFDEIYIDANLFYIRKLIKLRD